MGEEWRASGGKFSQAKNERFGCQTWLVSAPCLQSEHTQLGASTASTFNPHYIHNMATADTASSGPLLFSLPDEILFRIVQPTEPFNGHFKLYRERALICRKFRQVMFLQGAEARPSTARCHCVLYCHHRPLLVQEGHCRGSLLMLILRLQASSGYHWLPSASGFSCSAAGVPSSTQWLCHSITTSTMILNMCRRLAVRFAKCKVLK